MRSDLRKLAEQEAKRAELSEKVFKITTQVVLEQAQQDLIPKNELLNLQKNFEEQRQALDKENLQRKQEIQTQLKNY